MDIINSVFTICNTVSETDRQYKILAKRLQYQLQKAEHLLKTQKIKNVPEFIVLNLKKSIEEAKKHLQNIQKLLRQNSIPLKQKIKLSLPFNKTNQLVKLALQQLEKAQQDVSNYEFESQPQNNYKRFTTIDSKFSDKKQQTSIFNLKDSEVNDQEIQDVVMGPTLQQDTAIGFVKNKYINIQIGLKGQDYIINTIAKTDKRILNFKKKVLMKFQNQGDNLIQEIQLFSLGRVYFRTVYKKLVEVYTQIDGISKNNHFFIKLRRKKQKIIQNNQNQSNQKNQSEYKTTEIQPTPQIVQQQVNQKCQKKQIKDMFFSFPTSLAPVPVLPVYKETINIIVEKAGTNIVYYADMTGAWIKMQQQQRQLCKGDQIAAFIPNYQFGAVPDLYFKINFEILE